MADTPDLLLDCLDANNLSWSHVWEETFRKNALRGALLQEIAFELRIRIDLIDCNASFVRNGGDSISALRISSSCRAKGLNITVGALLTCASIRKLIELADRFHTNQLLPHEAPLTPRSDIEDTPNNNTCRVTDTQLSFIYGSRASPGQNVIRYSETYSPESIPSMKEAWKTLVTLEPIFRTHAELRDENYYIAEKSEATFVWDELVVDNREAYVRELQELELSTDFTGSCFKVVSLKSNDDAPESTVIWTIHHALIDGYSKVLLLNKHRRILSGQSIKPAPSFVQHVAQIAVFRDTWQPNSERFWTQELEILERSKHELLLPKPEIPFTLSYAREEVTVKVSRDDLAQLALESGVTIASIYCAAWALTIRDYVDSDDIAFGIVLLGRSVPLVESVDVLGPLINTVPFPIRIEYDQTVSQYLAAVFKHYVELDSFQWNMSQHGVARPLSSTLNIHAETPLLEPTPLPMVREPSTSVISELPLRIEVQLSGKLELFYHQHVFQEIDIKRLGERFAHAVQSLLTPNCTIRDCLESLNARDMKSLLTNGNCKSVATHMEFWNENLVQLFDTTAMANLNRTAVEKSTETLTYSELYWSSTQIAMQLARHSDFGDVVCVYADRSLEWIIAIYGVLKAGGVYCPLEEGLPSVTKDEYFTQTSARVFLVGRNDQKNLRPKTCMTCLSVEELLGDATDCPALASLSERQARLSNGEAGAYLCFSSGTSGSPKGILCTHRSLVAFQNDSGHSMAAFTRYSPP
ncbi:hypothetical protein BCR34DRAFT_606851 [Clohesyomyces aquaticus]|uniref:Carrier domain-containing protein n=1 Tax=Clohesyomyces aquaticus TaxID=1231657 RepID=A0A1Y1YKW1_9PLEO|nr:hypothetical protein BCR34DRAFT_606851 [Clohesyomyces aquaticus]